jgi:hypothetical protein
VSCRIVATLSRKGPAECVRSTGQVYQGLLCLLQLRGQNLAFTRADTDVVETGNQHVVFVLANFSEQEQWLEARCLRQMGMRKTRVDLYAGRIITAVQELLLEPCQIYGARAGGAGAPGQVWSIRRNR